jgi:hypothetical protein
MRNGGVLVLSLWVFTFAVADMALGGRSRVVRVDDFEDGDRQAASGLSWVSIASDLMGGASIATLRVTAGGAEASRHALRVSGEVTTDGFAGAWVALDGRSRATDISDFQGVRLRARGQGRLQFSVRGGPSPGFNYSFPFEAGADWTAVEIRFDSLKPLMPQGPPLDLRSIGWLGVSVARGGSGPFQFDIDDVELYATRADARLRVQHGPTLAAHFTASPPSAVPPGAWSELLADARGDGKQARLPDATAVSVRRDGSQHRVWFRIALSAPMPDRWLGANLALDVDGDPGNGMAWWGTNQAFRFDRLVSVWGMESGSGYQGIIGIADAKEVEAGNLAGAAGDQVLVVLEQRPPAIVVGIPTDALGMATAPVRLVAAVGSSFQHNDDVPDTGAALLPR